MSQINKQDIISEDALEAPLILRKNFEGLLDTAKEFIGSAKQYDDALRSASKTSQDHRDRTKELTDEQRVLAQITKQVATESAKQSDAYGVLHARLQELKQTTKDNLTISAEEAKNISLRTSSIERYSQALERNRKAYARLQTEQQRNSAEGKKLLSIIQEQDKTLQSLHPTLEKTEGKLFLMSEALNKMGEGGVRVNEMLLHIAETVTSGWSLMVGGIGLAAAALQTFFSETEEGRIKMEIFEDQTITRWSIFKNKVAETTKAIIEFAEADEATRKFHEQQRVARMTPEQLKDYQKQQAIDNAQKDITLTKIKLIEHEAEVTEELSQKRHEAVEAELDARKTDNDNLTRLTAIIKANKLYNEVHQQEIFLLRTRNEALVADIQLRATGRKLRGDELLQIANLRKEVIENDNAFLSSTKRRIALESSLQKAINDAYEAEVKKNREARNNAILGKSQSASDESKRIKEFLESSGITANADLNKLREDLSKKSLDDLKKFLEEAKKLRNEDNKKQAEQQEALREIKVRSAEQAAHSIDKIVNDQFEAQAQAHEHYLDRTRENYQEELQMAAGNKIAQAQLTSQFREKEKREQLEIVKIKRRQAQFDKDVAILDITLKTAQAVMADLAKYQEAAGPFIAYDEAIGAAQLIAVAAKPLPSYDVGTKNHPGGPAVVHPFELMWGPKGDVAMTPNKPTVLDLPKGTEVSTTDETIRMLALAGLANSMSFERSDNTLNQVLIGQLKEVKNAIENIPQPDFHAMMAGYYTFKEKSETFRKKVMIEKFGRR